MSPEQCDLLQFDVKMLKIFLLFTLIVIAILAAKIPRK